MAAIWAMLFCQPTDLPRKMRGRTQTRRCENGRAGWMPPRVQASPSRCDITPKAKAASRPGRSPRDPQCVADLLLIEGAEDDIDERGAEGEHQVAVREAAVLEVPLHAAAQVDVVREGAAGYPHPETTNGADRRHESRQWRRCGRTHDQVGRSSHRMV